MMPATKLFRFNLFLIVAVGGGASGWILLRTDWFPEIGGLLALGGLFSWLAFVFKIIPEETVKDLQSRTYCSIFNKTVTPVLVLCLAGSLVYLASHVVTIQVEAFEGTADRSIWIQGSGAKNEPLRLPPAGRVRLPLWNPSWSRTQYDIKVSGYPRQSARVGFWRPMELRVPHSFYRRVVLVRPAAALIGIMLDLKPALSVRIGDRECREKGYDGYAFWVGSDDDVQIPAALQAQLKADLAAENKPLYESRWLYPRKLDAACSDVELDAKDPSRNRILVRLIKANGQLYGGEQVIEVRPLSMQRPQDFVQLEDLYGPS